MSTPPGPLVSIGLPVRNGERFLEAAIESILGQQLTDLELVISDNGSTDATQEICERYAARDRRVRYGRNETNIGGSNNHNLVFRRSRGRYFRWAGHDDIMAPSLLDESRRILEADPGVVLVHSRTMLINAEGDELGVISRPQGGAASPSARFLELMRWDHDCEASYGLMRAGVLRRTGLERNYTDSDRTLLCELALRGRFVEIDRPLFFRRIHPEMSTAAYQDWRERMAWFRAEGQSARAALPHWMQFAHYLEITLRASLPAPERLRCAGHLGRWLFMDRRWGRLANDLVIAGRQGLSAVAGQ